MIDFQAWLNRIDNSLELQKDMSYETITHTYTRRELIELRLMVPRLYDEQKAIDDVINRLTEGE